MEFVKPIHNYHVAHFYEGCLLQHDSITKEDKATAKRIKQYLEAIDDLKN